MAQDEQSLNWGDEGFSEEEIAEVQGIINASLDGYTFDPAYVPKDRWIVPAGIAPDWDALVRHCQATAAAVTQQDAEEAFAQTVVVVDEGSDAQRDVVVDEGSDLRLYPAYWKGEDPEENVPVAVVVSWRDRVVIGVS
jgi:hypothetical protein